MPPCKFHEKEESYFTGDDAEQALSVVKLFL